MSKRTAPRRTTEAPSKATAAGFLRTIAQQVNQPVADDVTRARDLQLIADCIEGRTRWRKGSAFTWEQERQIARGVVLIQRRPPKMTVLGSAQAHAIFLANKWGTPTRSKAIFNRILTLHRAARK